MVNYCNGNVGNKQWAGLKSLCIGEFVKLISSYQNPILQVYPLYKKLNKNNIFKNEMNFPAGKSCCSSPMNKQ